jgi:feruloyl-CoA synthase
MATGTAKDAPFVATAFAAPDIECVSRPDGNTILTSRAALGSYPTHQGEILEAWAERTPDNVLLAERRPDGRWRTLTYAEAAELSARVGQALLDRGHRPERPIAMLCDATVNMGVLKLAAMQVGIPVVPVSPAYSLMSQSFVKLRHVFEMIEPGLVYVSAVEPFARAIAAVDLRGATVVTDEPEPALSGAISFEALTRTPPGLAFRSARARVDGDTVAKILLTSGSTGMPKGVINTQRMLCSNGKAVDLVWPFLAKRPPVIVDWLPWSHTFGTNFNFSQILRHGGAMYIDAGKPMPGRIETTLKNLREIRPTLLYNVPRGFDALLPHIELEDDFAVHLFGDLDAIFYAGAALPQNIWDRLETAAMRVRGGRVPILSALGSTETAPVATLGHWGSDVANTIGLPVPGTEIKLVPTGGKLEIRVRGPNVTPGYFRAPELTAKAFDEEGFFRLGDAVKLIDLKRPERGLQFDGRVSENFKLMSGTWVAAGNVRLAAIAAGAPMVQDAVVTGHDRQEIGLLIFPNPAGCRAVAKSAPADTSIEDLIRRPEVRDRLFGAFARHNVKHPGSSTRIARALLMTEPPSVDGNEITDKGYINQRGVLDRRTALVERLYADDGAEDVIVVDVPESANRAAEG